MPNSMNTSPIRVVMKALTAALRAEGFAIPEADQQVGAQAHDLPTHEQCQQVIGDHKRVHAKGKQTEERKEARVHRLDRRHDMLVSMLFHGRAMRRQTCMIMIAFRLAKILIANAVKEDHQDCPWHEEQHRRAERVNQHADLEPRIARRQPVDRNSKGCSPRCSTPSARKKTTMLPSHESSRRAHSQWYGSAPCSCS